MKRILILLLLFCGVINAQSNIMKLINERRDPFRMTINAASTTISMKGSGSIRVVWGDGSYTDYTLTSTAQNVTHTYSVSALYKIAIYNPQKVTYWGSSDNAAYAFNWAETQKMRMTYFYCSGSNTLSGTLSLPSGMTNFVCYGSNTLSGALSLPSGMTTFGCYGANTLSGYSTQSFSNSTNYFYLITSGGTGFSAAEVDQLCIDLDGSAWAGSSRTLRLTGGAIAAPTATSAGARASLVVKGVTVTVNP